MPNNKVALVPQLKQPTVPTAATPHVSWLPSSVKSIPAHPPPPAPASRNPRHQPVSLQPLTHTPSLPASVEQSSSHGKLPTTAPWPAGSGQSPTFATARQQAPFHKPRLHLVQRTSSSSHRSTGPFPRRLISLHSIFHA